MALLVFGGGELYSAEARGVRNCNPGNIRSEKVHRWPGAIGVDEEGYLRFRRPEDGLRAIVINLKAYRDKHGIRTPYWIVKRWTRGESPEGQMGYAYYLAIGFNQAKPNRHERLDMWDVGVLAELTRRIVQFECGYEPYTLEMYRKVFPALPKEWW